VSRYDESFEVKERVGVVVYTLILPKWLELHLTFHANYLKPFYKDIDDPLRGNNLKMALLS
jgi:hypothetical protein